MWAVGCAEGPMASALVEMLRGRRPSGSSAIRAMDATSWDATGWGLDVARAGRRPGRGMSPGAGPGAGRGPELRAAGGEFSAMVAGLGEGDGGGVGVTEAADTMAAGGIDGGAVGEPAVCGGAAASSNAGVAARTGIAGSN